MNSVEELIQNSIADANIASTKRKRNENSNSSNDNEDNNDNEEKPVMCKYIPGRSAEGCMVCSS
jgi:hypothetical protein